MSSEETEIEVQMSEPTMIGDLMDLVLTELRLVEKPWQQLSEDQQAEILYRAERRVKAATRKAIDILAAGDTLSVKAEVESVTFKDGAKAVLKCVGPTTGFHDLADCTKEGTHVLVVVPDDAVLHQEHDHQADPDQGTMPLDNGEARGDE